jgi:hypothetical protein
MFEYLSPRDGPVIDGLEELEVVYAKDQPQYRPLRVLRSADYARSCFSRWTPTEEQRKAIAEGADIFLELLTYGGPLAPSRIAVSDGSLDLDWAKENLLRIPSYRNVVLEPLAQDSDDQGGPTLDPSTTP